MKFYNPPTPHAEVEVSIDAPEVAIALGAWRPFGFVRAGRVHMFAEPPVPYVRPPIGEGEHWQPSAPLPGKAPPMSEIAF